MKLSETRVELLAPAGRWDAFNAVIDAGADAVYIGGKRFNMRLHRSDFNFTDEQITEAVRFAHEREVKLYITVNNLLCALLFISWPFLVSGKKYNLLSPNKEQGSNNSHVGYSKERNNLWQRPIPFMIVIIVIISVITLCFINT